MTDKTDREIMQQALYALDSKHDMTKAEWRYLQYHAFNDLRERLAKPDPRNQCGETCERAKLCAVCLAEMGEQPEPQEPLPWMRVIDEAMVVHHCGVADPADDYETAKRKLNILLCCTQDIGAYFAKQAELVQEPEQGPVAYVCWSNPNNADGTFSDTRIWLSDKPEGYGHQRLYTAPQQREWQGLTDKEMKKLADTHLVYQPEDDSYERSGVFDLIRAVEAKLKEKND